MYSIGAAISPATKARRHATSPGAGRKSPPTIPLMPAILPFTSTNIATAAPMITPPIVADHGVKAVQSICIGVRRGRLLRPRPLESASSCGHAAGACLRHRLRQCTGGVPNLFLDAFVAVERVVAGGVRLVIADEAVEQRLVAHGAQSHPVEPVGPHPSHRFVPRYIAMHDHTVHAPGTMPGITPTRE